MGGRRAGLGGVLTGHGLVVMRGVRRRGLRRVRVRVRVRVRMRVRRLRPAPVLAAVARARAPSVLVVTAHCHTRCDIKTFATDRTSADLTYLIRCSPASYSSVPRSKASIRRRLTEIVREIPKWERNNVEISLDDLRFRSE